MRNRLFCVLLYVSVHIPYVRLPCTAREQKGCMAIDTKLTSVITSGSHCLLKNPGELKKARLDFLGELFFHFLFGLK